MKKNILLFLIITFTVISSTLILINFFFKNDNETLLLKNNEINIKKFNNYVNKKIKKSGTIGLAISIIKNDKVIYSNCYGYSNKLKKEYINKNTLFRAGSISKVLTVIAIYKAINENKFKLDTPIYDIDKNLKFYNYDGKLQKITIRQLITHHSGIMSDYINGILSDTNLDTLINRIKTEKVFYSPDYVLSYSNVGYSILGYILTKVYQKKFIDIMNDMVSNDLKLKNTIFSNLPDNIKNIAIPYNNQKQQNNYKIRDLAAGGIITSLDDLTVLIKNLINFKIPILNDNQIKEMFIIQNNNIYFDYDLKIGLPWFIENNYNNSNITVATHEGEPLFFCSQISIVPEKKIGIILLSNSSSSLNMINEITKKLLDEFLLINNYKQKGNLTLNIKNVNYDIEGTYFTQLGLINIKKENNNYIIKFNNKNFLLIKQKNNLYNIKYLILKILPIKSKYFKNFELFFDEYNHQKIIGLFFKNKKFLIGEKLLPSYISDAWINRLGEYTVINNLNINYKITNVSLKLEGKFIIITYSIPDLQKGIAKVPLKILDNFNAVIPSLGRAKGEYVYFTESNNKEYLNYSGFIALRSN